MNTVSINTLKDTIKKLKRSPKIGQIYELYRSEHDILIKEKTIQHQKALWCKHLSQLDNFRADNLTPLEFQHLVLNNLYQEEKFNTAENLTRMIVTMLDFAVATTIIKENPLKTVYNLPMVKLIHKKAVKNCVHRASFNHLSINTDLKKLVQVFKEKTTEHRIYLLHISLALLLRPGEIVKIKINNLDESKQLLKVQDTKTLDNFLIPLNESMIVLLKRIYEKYGNQEKGYIFRGHRYSDYLSPQTLNVALKKLGYKGILCAHGIRSIGSNFFAHHAKEVPPYVREAILQHAVGKVEKAYRRDDSYLKQRRKAMELWYEYLDNLFSQNS